MLGPPVLLSYYVVCVIPCGPGILSSLSPFLGCHSGSSELAWGFRGTPSDIRVRCPASGCALHPRLCLGWASWVFPCYVFSWLSSLALGCGVLYFRHGFCDEHSGPSLAPRFAGLTVPAQPTRDNRNGRLLFPVQAVRGTWSALASHRQRCERSPFCRTL